MILKTKLIIIDKLFFQTNVISLTNITSLAIMTVRHKLVKVWTGFTFALFRKVTTASHVVSARKGI